jgi:RNA polymerase sigma factor (sigma-70 family)
VIHRRTAAAWDRRTEKECILNEQRDELSGSSNPCACDGQRSSMWPKSANRERFDSAILPHLNAAFNLARWLTRSDQDAQDVVQDACLRALKFFDGFHGQDARTWLLKIVRNTSYTWLKQNRAHELTGLFDENIHTAGNEGDTPESLLLENADRAMLTQALEQLPVEWRETMILRELEGLSYREIAAVTDTPIGTVMSRLARARTRLQDTLMKTTRTPRTNEARHGL